MFDHQKQTTTTYSGGPDVSLQEMTFVPRNAKASEADGYLIGIADNRKENGRSDLILVDTRQMDAGPIARVKMPYRVVGQVHGFWVSGNQLPKET